MKKLLPFNLLLLLLVSTVVNAQWQNDLWTGKQAYNWHFGVRAGLNFNTTPPTAITNSQIAPQLNDPNDPLSVGYIEGTGAISDVDGNLLFYTNGVRVWNANNQVMPNGFGLLAHSDPTQTGLIVPVPGQPGHYYIFYVSYIETGLESIINLYYSEVDMTLDNGLGDVTSNKNVLLAVDVMEKFSTVYHADKEQVWLVAHTRLSNEFKSFLISEAGINASPRVSNTGFIDPNGGAGVGQMKISPDGTKIATSTPIFGPDKNIELYSFNNITGEIALEATINADYFDNMGDIVGAYGLEFSPNNKFLYASALFTGKVHQFDVSLEDEQAIQNSGIMIGQSTHTTNFNLQAAPDGKIYVAHGSAGPDINPYVGSESTLSVINYPNNAGVASGFEEAAVDLVDGRNDLSIPSFIQSYFQSGILYEGGNCPTQNVTFSTIRIPGIESIAWNFGDTASGAANTSTDLEPAHAFTAGGTYTVTAVITSNGAQQTATTTLIILPAPLAVAPQGTIITQCADANGSATFNLNQLNNTILGGQDANAFTIAYYANEADLQSDTPVANAATFTTTGQELFARVINNATGCFKNISFTLVVNPLPLATAPASIEACVNTTGEAVFNLTQQDAVILGNQDPFQFTVTYYASLQDVQNNNPVSTATTFTSSGQTVYAVVTNTATGCTVVTQFDVVPLALPVITNNLEYTGCSPFNLPAITAQQGQGLTFTFYADEQDAATGNNAIVDAVNYVAQGNRTTIYIAAENAQGCTVIAQLQLNPGNCTIPRGISPNNDGFNDRFDLSGFNVEQLSIFNRYGAEVFSLANYTNEWHGQTDNNNDLPTGTYYYSIQTSTGEQKTGWVYINREVN
jgi:gliding motility-associated-like protein